MVGRDCFPQGIGMLLGKETGERRCILTQYRNLESHLCFLSGYLLAVVRSLESRLRTVAVGSKKRI